VVRNGYLPKRTITTGLGPVEVRRPRVHDRPTKRSLFPPRFFRPTCARPRASKN
jgi:hypothetical protein